MPLIAVPERFKPAGREPALIDNKNGAVPPVAFSVCEYAAPADPLGKVGALVMVQVRRCRPRQIGLPNMVELIGPKRQPPSVVQGRDFAVGAR